MKTILMAMVTALSMNAYAGRTCEFEKIDREHQEIKSSQYWTKQISNLAKLMGSQQSRTCIQKGPTEQFLMIFMDDLEFTGSEENRKLARHGSYSNQWGSNAESSFYIYAEDDQFFQKGVSVISFMIRTGNFQLPVKTCSPKEALAYLIAYAEYLGCRGAGVSDVDAAIEAKAQEVLKGE